jgi:phage tail sheath protein FI
MSEEDSGSVVPAYPGVYVEELPDGVAPIAGVETSTTAFVGRAPQGPVGEPVAVDGFGEFEQAFGGVRPGFPAASAVRDFFLNGGRRALVVRLAGSEKDGLEPADYLGSREERTGFYALEKADLFNLLCIPPDGPDGDSDPGVYREALDYCRERRAVLVVDPPASWTGDPEEATRAAASGLSDLGLKGQGARNAALYYPRALKVEEGVTKPVPPSGLVAGVIARTDATRGVWKAPAGREASIGGIAGLAVQLTDEQNGELNPMGINCLRTFPDLGPVVWGARTLAADEGEWKYLPVRRLALYLEESLHRGTRWAVFEPNDEPLWSALRLQMEIFLQALFRAGAFQGRTPREAYFVRCDDTTMTQDDVDQGRVNIVVGFAPLRPAEFVIITISQLAAAASEDS